MRIKWQDVALTVALLVFGLVGTKFAARFQTEAFELGVPAYLLITVAASGLLLRTLRPLWTFGVTAVAIAIYLAVGYPFGPILLSGVAAMYALGRYGSRRSVFLCALLYTLAVVPAFRQDGVTAWITWSAGWIVLPAVAGVLIGVRQRSAVDAREHAVISERLHLAQEVHDVVGHGLSVIAMQAGVALYVLDKDIEKARASLVAIRDTSKEALEGLRSELDTLRGSAPLRPSTSLADLPALQTRMREAGLEVSIEVDGVAVPDNYELTAYRIVQESLTNVLRHASPGVTAAVRVYTTKSELFVEIADTGTPGPFAEGHGITGMRTRAEALGGTLTAGPVEDGFAVIARIPLPS